VERLHATIDELQQRVGIDHLTGAATRAVIEAALTRELGRLGRFGHPVALAFCDVDRFKAVNDRFGHAAGDDVLKQVYATLHDACRSTDLVGRWGGEEFAVVLPNTGAVGARVMGERLRAAVAATRLPLLGAVTISVGVAEAVQADTWQSLVERADRAMYEAKSTGRNRVWVARTPREEAGNDSVAGGFLRLVWRDAYRCGEQTIDAQHERLFADANAVLDAAAAGLMVDTVALFAALIEDCRIHFADEERLLHALAVDALPAHVAVHARLLADAERLLQRLRSGAAAPGQLFDFIACDLVAGHLLKEDRCYFERVAAALRDGRQETD
nr:diguanylate cyclase [Burkholderiaceae bacterium]